MSLILSGKAASCKVSISLPDGREETFHGKCSINSHNLTSGKTSVDVIEENEFLKKEINAKLEADLESLNARNRLISSLSVSKNSFPFSSSPSLLTSILPRFHINHEITPKTIEKPRNITPESSPEIIVDKLTPECPEVFENKEENVSSCPSTPSRPRGPKKNFLARQAALDATLNVLRMRAEKSNDDKETPPKSPGKDVSLEMSDSEMLDNHIDT